MEYISFIGTQKSQPYSAPQQSIFALAETLPDHRPVARQAGETEKAASLGGGAAKLSLVTNQARNAVSMASR